MNFHYLNCQVFLLQKLCKHDLTDKPCNVEHVVMLIFHSQFNICLKLFCVFHPRQLIARLTIYIAADNGSDSDLFRFRAARFQFSVYNRRNFSGKYLISIHCLALSRTRLTAKSSTFQDIYLFRVIIFPLKSNRSSQAAIVCVSTGFAELIWHMSHSAHQ